MAALTVTKLWTIGRPRGLNTLPPSGDVEFSDGKCYGWSFHPLDKVYFFHGWRKMPHGGSERFMFRSPKRAELLLAALNAGQCVNEALIVEF